MLLFSCAGSLFDQGGYASDEFISFGTPDKDFCTNKCEKYGILKYGQIDIETGRQIDTHTPPGQQ